MEWLVQRHGQLRVVDDGGAQRDRHVQYQRWRNGYDLREPGDVHQPDGQLQHDWRGLLSDQPEHRRVGMLELRWTHSHGEWRGSHLRAAAAHEGGRWLLLLCGDRGTIRLGELVRLVGMQS